MKINVSVSEEDVELIDAYARSSGLNSRSAAVQHAIRMLRHEHLEEDYVAAWSEWEDSAEAAAWESTAADGLTDAAR